MQDLENAVRDALQKAEKFQVLAGYGELYHALGALSIALAEHEAKPKREDVQKGYAEGLHGWRAEVERLQGELRTAKQEAEIKQRGLQAANRLYDAECNETAQLRREITTRIALAVDAKDSLGKEIQRLQGELQAQKSYTQSLGEDRLRVSNERDALKGEVECLKVELRGANLDIADKRRVIDELRVKLSQATAKADADVKAVAEFRAAWAKLKGMLE